MNRVAPMIGHPTDENKPMRARASDPAPSCVRAHESNVCAAGRACRSTAALMRANVSPARSIKTKCGICLSQRAHRESDAASTLHATRYLGSQREIVPHQLGDLIELFQAQPAALDGVDDLRLGVLLDSIGTVRIRRA